MSCHDGHHSVIDQSLIDFAEGGIPFFTAQIIDPHEQMLVIFFSPVPRKMFAACSKSVLSCTFKKCFCIAYSIFRAVVKSPGLHNSISPVICQVYHRGKIPVTSYGSRFSCAYERCLISCLL